MKQEQFQSILIKSNKYIKQHPAYAALKSSHFNLLHNFMYLSQTFLTIYSNRNFSLALSGQRLLILESFLHFIGSQIKFTVSESFNQLLCPGLGLILPPLFQHLHYCLLKICGMHPGDGVQLDLGQSQFAAQCAPFPSKTLGDLLYGNVQFGYSRGRELKKKENIFVNLENNI